MTTPLYPLYALGYQGGAPKPAEIDSIASRLAQAQGIATGTKNIAAGAANAYLIPAAATAGQASDLIQAAIDEHLEPARAARYQAATALMSAAGNALAAAGQTAAQTAQILHPPKRKRNRKPKAEPEPIVKGPPAPVPLPTPTGNPLGNMASGDWYLSPYSQLIPHMADPVKVWGVSPAALLATTLVPAYQAIAIIQTTGMPDPHTLPYYYGSELMPFNAASAGNYWADYPNGQAVIDATKDWITQPSFLVPIQGPPPQQPAPPGVIGPPLPPIQPPGGAPPIAPPQPIPPRGILPFPPVVPPVVPPGGPCCLPPPIVVNVPPCPACPQCGAPPPPPIYITLPPPIILPVPPAPVLLPPSPPGSPPPPPPPPGCFEVSICNWPKPPSPPAPPPPPPPVQCTLSIAWLALNHAQFVLAERASTKTDFDILMDAFELGLCGPAPEMPACSMPFLERMAPGFIEAAKAQGLSDDETLASAVRIGLCATPPPPADLGEINVTQLAPGSAPVIEAEFDPPASSFTADIKLTPIATAGNDWCWQIFVLPAPDPALASKTLPGLDCLRGWERGAAFLVTELAELIRNTANCGSGSLTEALGVAANNLYNQNSWWSRVSYNVLQSINWLIREVAANSVQVENWIAALARCDTGEAGPVLVAGLMLGLIDRWVLTLPKSLRQAVETVTALACPTTLPSGAEANTLRAHDYITHTEWECIHRREGNILDFQAQSVELERNRPSDHDLLLLWRKFPDRQAQIMELFDHNGWSKTSSWELWKQAQDWVPSPTDAIQFMLKDVADQQIQDKFLLGAEFSQKYNGHVKEVFDWNGVAEKDANLIWRAHWKNMPPHQLYEMHKRLRPGYTDLWSAAEIMHMIAAVCPVKPAGVTAAQLAARPVSNGFPVPMYCDELPDAIAGRLWLESLVTTGTDLDVALGQDDYAPFWRARLMAISYRVMGRIDLRRAYETSSISYERLQAGMQDQGYSPGDAGNIASFYRHAAVLLHTRRPAANQWVKTGYAIELLRQSLLDQGMRADMWEAVLAVLQTRRAVVIQQECLKSLQKQYLLNLLTAQQAAERIAQLTPPPDDASRIIEEWNCLKSARSKQETAAQLCMNFRLGLMTGKEAQRAIMGLGYTLVQARRILATCYIRKLPKSIQKDKLAEALGQLG